MPIDVMNQFPATPGAAGAGGAFSVAYYAIVSMLVLVGFAYLLSKVLNNRKLEEWSKDELVQALISAAMVGGLVLLLAPQNGVLIKVFNSLMPSGENVTIPVYYSKAVSGMGNTVVTTVTFGMVTGVFKSGLVNETINPNSIYCPGGSQGTVLCFSYSYLGLLQSSMIGLSEDLLAFNIVIELLASLSLNLILVSLTPLSGLTSVGQVTGSFIQSLMFLGVITGVEMALLQFINSTALSIFLPIGVVLRSFFATRRIGGMLMALAIGLYMVFPLTLALNAVSAGQAQSDSYAQLSDLFSLTGNLNPYTTTTNPNEAEWANYGSKVSTNLQNLLTLVKILPILAINLLSSLVVQVVFLPLLSVMITLAAIKELAGLFGSEINLSRFEV
jgi:hypothetical protein